MLEEIVLLGKGMAVGLSVSAPVGPIGIMCIRRTLSHGPKWGFAVGLGAVTADMIYASAAAFGISAISGYLLRWETGLRLLAAAIVAWLAYRALRATKVDCKDEPAETILGTYGTSFALVISNPAAIAIFTGVFVGLGLTSVVEWRLGVAIVLGVVTGAVSWWAILTGTLTFLKPRVDENWLRKVNLVSGVALAGISLLILISIAL
jgi:putative LysE/RhtB family amino acid efflux pump